MSKTLRYRQYYSYCKKANPTEQLKIGEGGVMRFGGKRIRLGEIPTLYPRRCDGVGRPRYAPKTFHLILPRLPIPQPNRVHLLRNHA